MAEERHELATGEIKLAGAEGIADETIDGVETGEVDFVDERGDPEETVTELPMLP